MGFGLEYDAANRVVRWSLDGEITDEAFSANLKLVAEALATLSAKSGIVDLSAVTILKVSNRVLMELAESDPILPAAFPRVIVAPRDSIYGLARMFTTLSEETRPNLHVVRTMDEAYELLGLESPKFHALGLRRRAEV